MINHAKYVVVSSVCVRVVGVVEVAGVVEVVGVEGTEFLGQICLFIWGCMPSCFLFLLFSIKNKSY